MSTVLMCCSSAPDFARQLAPNDFQPLSSAVFSASVSGDWSSCMTASTAAPFSQTTGVEPPVPRGSQPTMSYCSSPAVAKPTARFVPGSPGPPGFTKIVPSFGVLVATTLASLSVIAWPSGAA